MKQNQTVCKQFLIECILTKYEKYTEWSDTFHISLKYVDVIIRMLQRFIIEKLTVFTATSI